MMDQAQIGYTMWQEPPKQVMPKGERVTAEAGARNATAAEQLRVEEAAVITPADFIGFVEKNGYVSIEAGHMSRRVDASPVKWRVIPDLGRTLSGITVFPTNVPQQMPGGASAHLEYDVLLKSAGSTKVTAYISPSQDFTCSGGLEYAVSFDDQPPQRVNINKDASAPAWERDVANNISLTTTEHQLDQPGVHMLKFWMVDLGVVLEKLVTSRGGVPESYLGPPESVHFGIET